MCFKKKCFLTKKKNLLFIFERLEVRSPFATFILPKKQLKSNIYWGINVRSTGEELKSNLMTIEGICRQEKGRPSRDSN